MFPYEAYFYSSGGIEEEWGPKDLLTNRVTSIVGMGLGSLLAIAILASSAQLFGPANVGPRNSGQRRARGRDPVRQDRACCSRLLGMLFAVAGAAVETCMANAYSIVAILRLGMGPAQEAVGGAALHPRLDRPVRCSRCAIVLTGVDVDEPGRICGAVLDPRAAADLSAAAAARRRQELHGRACQQAAREGARLVLFRDRSPPPRSPPSRSIC